MKIVGEPILCKFFTGHVDGRAKARAWLRVVKTARWHSIHDVRKEIPSADGGVKELYTIFNIKQYRIVTRIDFGLEAVQIVDIFTHDEYIFWSNKK